PAWSMQMSYDTDADRCFGEFTVDKIGRWHYTVEAWTDVWETWRAGFRKKVDAGQDVHLELKEAAEFVHAAARRAKRGPARAALTQTAKAFDHADKDSDEGLVRRALDSEVTALMRENFLPRDLTRYRRELAIVVDREPARFGSWYEFFPRYTDPSGKHGTFVTAVDALPRIQELGFDVIYLPPIHPTGRTFRKGKNNALNPAPDDVGSPWAIGNEQGGHDAVDPALGTLADFDRFVASARGLGLEISLDYALQCSPDHPWVKEHPDWFNVRPDGSIQYAENPPKKYQDIYPLNFESPDWRGLWEALRDVFIYWIRRNVRIFRVDNPHTKALPFWEWCIAEINKKYPDVILLAEAFTRPHVMYSLAKAGFTQSYTYFTWRNTRNELQEYFEEITKPPISDFFRA